MPLALCETFCLSSIALILAMHKRLMHFGQRACCKEHTLCYELAFSTFSGCSHPSWSRYMLAVSSQFWVAGRWT